MLCREIMEILERAYPCGYALDWDNVGLLVGRDDREVKRIYIALDADDDAVDAAVRLGRRHAGHPSSPSLFRA